MEGTKFTDPELVAMAPNLMKENASLQSEIDRLKEEKKELMKYYDKLMEARSKLMFIAANTFNEEVQQQSNTAWQTITDITFILTRIK